MLIVTEKASDQEIIHQIRQKFNLVNGPLSDIDDEFLLLAFIPKNLRNIESVSKKKIVDKYETTNHQTLEFYGDRILYGLVSHFFIERFRLRISAHRASELSSFITSNQNLTRLMERLDACKLVRMGGNFVMTNKNHNPCVDSLEALVGAVYVYSYEWDIPYERVYEWFLDTFKVDAMINWFERENIRELHEQLTTLSQQQGWHFHEPVSEDRDGYTVQFKGREIAGPTLLDVLENLMKAAQQK